MELGDHHNLGHLLLVKRGMDNREEEEEGTDHRMLNLVWVLGEHHRHLQ